MVRATRWESLRKHVPQPGEDEAPRGYTPRDRAELWMLFTTYDRAEGKDELTGEPLKLQDAVIIVSGSMSHSTAVHKDTWAEKKQEVIENLAGLPILSTIVAADLEKRVP